MKKKTKRITLAYVVEMIGGLRNEMNAGFKQVNTRIDGLEARMDKLETRIDRIDQRLDYNGLKKLPN